MWFIENTHKLLAELYDFIISERIFLYHVKLMWMFGFAQGQRKSICINPNMCIRHVDYCFIHKRPAVVKVPSRQ